MKVLGDSSHPGLTTLIVPTCGGPALAALLEALATQTVAVESPIIVVDDRPGVVGPLATGDTDLQMRVMRSGGVGPAAARNIGWRAAHTPWVSFIDDDVVPAPDWYEALLEDIDALPVELMGSQGQAPAQPREGRRLTESERDTAFPATAVWGCADLTVRRAALAAVGGFDERFRRAYREDVDLALRVTQRLGGIEIGSRSVAHPPRSSDFWSSVRAQADAADDMLMLRLHGPDWHRAAAAPYERRWLHLGIAGSGLLAVSARLAGHRRLARAAALCWLGGTGELAVRRILPGPRDREDVTRMAVTSAVIPFAAAWHTARGLWRWRDVRQWRGLPDLVLFDSDGGLIHDAADGGRGQTSLVAEAAEAVALLRGRGVSVGMVTHVTDGADTVLAACEQAAADPERTVVIGDTAVDIAAARAAGAVGILVSGATADSVGSDTAPLVASTLAKAVELALTPSELWPAESDR